MIAVHEKGYHRINVRAVQGDSEGLTLSDNPVTRVSKFIAEVSALKLTIKMPAQVREMFTALLPYMNFPLRLIFANLWCFEPLLIKLMPKINSQAAATLGTTCVFGSIESKKGKTPRDNEVLCERADKIHRRRGSCRRHGEDKRAREEICA